MLTSRELSDFFASGPWPLDGGLATTLEQRGFDISGPLWSGRALLEAPDAVREVHEAFCDAGAAVAISASYQVAREGFAAAGLNAGDADKALVRSVEIARAAVDACRTVTLVAASVGPYGAILHDGSEYRGRYGLSREALRAFHAARLEVLARAEPDLFAVETIPDVAEVEALVEALEDLPAWITFSCRDAATTCAGQPIEDAVAVAASSDSVVAVGVNCTAPEHMTELVERIASTTETPIVVYPNGGRVWAANQWSGELTGIAPSEAGRWMDAGAAAVGGCCETTPQDVSLLAYLCATRRAAKTP